MASTIGVAPLFNVDVLFCSAKLQHCSFENPVRPSRPPQRMGITRASRGFFLILSPMRPILVAHTSGQECPTSSKARRPAADFLILSCFCSRSLRYTDLILADICRVPRHVGYTGQILGLCTCLSGNSINPTRYDADGSTVILTP